MNSSRFKFLDSESSLHTTQHKINGKQKRWRAAILLLVTLILGYTSAFIHHIMNQTLNDKAVASIAWSQQWSSYFGIALAFLTQVFFASCARIAFVQRQWLNMSTRHEAIRIKDIDTLSNALTDPFSLSFPLLWRKHPLLFIMATISWIIPFAALITPGTLSVESKPLATILDLQAPKLSLEFEPYTGDQIPEDGGGGFWSFNLEASQQLSKLAFGIATSSKVSPMRPYSANQTFPLSLIGPALECVEANETMVAQASNFMGNFGLSFISWAGESSPWISGTNIDIFQLTPLASAVGKETNTTENTLWITSCGSPCIVVRCQLWNASYEVQLTYQNFEQNYNIQSITYSNAILTPVFSSKEAPYPTVDKTIPYRAVTYAIGKLLVGLVSGETTRSSRGLLNVDFNSSEQIIRGMEEFSHNLTLSLLSVPTFLANDTDTVATNITTWSNVYQYRPLYLLLIYGLIFLLSGGCCLVGLHAIYTNGSSFQNNFSTHIRAVKSSDLNIEAILPLTDVGADPLPESLGNQAVRFNQRKEKP